MIYVVRGEGLSGRYVRISISKDVLWLTHWTALNYDGRRVAGWRSMVGEKVPMEDRFSATGIWLEEGEYTVMEEVE